MFKNLIPKSFNATLNTSSMWIARKEVNAAGFNSFFTSATFQNKSSAKKDKEKEADENLAYHQDLNTGIESLERLGVAKSYWSWPQYNRVIYPPTEDGKPSKTPVKLMSY